MSSSKPDDPPPGRWGDDPRRTLLALSRYTRSGVRSTAQARAYLRRRGVSAAATSRAVTAARARGLIDDRAGARLWAEHWARRGYAWVAIRVKLSAKGFEERVVQSLERTVGTAAEDAARARQLVARLNASRGRHQRARLARALASRGFNEDVIEQSLAESYGSIPSC